MFALMRNTLRVPPILLGLLTRREARENKVLIVGLTQFEIEVAVADHGAVRWIQDLLATDDFVRRVNAAVGDRYIVAKGEILNLKIKSRTHPPDVILRAIDSHYKEELEIRVVEEVARVVPKADARKKFVIVERVEGRTLQWVHVDGSGRRFVEAMFAAREFRERIGRAAGLPPAEIDRMLLGVPKRISPDLFKSLFDTVYKNVFEPEDSVSTLTLQRAKAEHGAAPRSDPQNGPDSDTRRFLTEIIRNAYIAHRASDVTFWFDSAAEKLAVRFCTDQIWGSVKYYAVSKAVADALINIIRYDCRIPPEADRSLPQSGSMRFTAADHGKVHRIDARIEIMPRTDRARTPNLFTVTARLFGARDALIPLERSGLLPFQLDCVRQIADRASGLLLVGGVTNSGKSHFLKSLSRLIHERHPGKKFDSIEDPVEIFLDFVNQCELPRRSIKVGGLERDIEPLDMLKGELRSNPSVLQMGEIRDLPSAAFARDAASTGIFTQSTIHIDNPFEGLLRLRELGFSPIQLAESLIAVIQCRLLPRLCPHCAEPDSTERIFEAFSGLEDLLKFWGANIERFDPLGRNPAGCGHCRGGYKGMIGAYEIWMPGRQKFQIAKGDDPNLIRETAIRNFGHWTSLRASMAHVFMRVVDVDTVMFRTNGIDPVHEGMERYSELEKHFATSIDEEIRKTDGYASSRPQDEPPEFMEAEVITDDAQN